MMTRTLLVLLVGMISGCVSAPPPPAWTWRDEVAACDARVRQGGHAEFQGVHDAEACRRYEQVSQYNEMRQYWETSGVLGGAPLTPFLIPAPPWGPGSGRRGELTCDSSVVGGSIVTTCR
jgi:hypothetical protein